MSDTIEIANFEQIATLMSHLMNNYSSMAVTYFNMFYNTTPQDIVLKLYDDTGKLQEYTVPNRAKDFKFTLNGEGSPEGVITAGIGTTYQDTVNGKLYIKQSASGSSTGWTLVGSEDTILKGSGSPEGVEIATKGSLFINLATGDLYIKKTDTGNTGWSLISADTSSLADRDLSNLTSTGEDHFANKSLNNLNDAGNQKFDDKEDVSNKVDSISSSSNDTQYPSAKATYTAIGDGVTAKVGNLSNLTTTSKTNVVSAINEVNAKNPLPSQTGNSGKFLTTNGSTARWDWVSGLPIGSIYSVNCTASYVPNGALPCDGSEYTKAQFNDLWTNYLNTVSPATEPLLKTCSYSDYQTAITTYGQCPMFAVDSVNNKFKVPTIKDGSYITQALSNGELGKSYKESLPNITGNEVEWMGAGVQSGWFSGAFKMEEVIESNTFTNTDLGGHRVSFDASRSSSTYQNNAKVQGDNVRLRYFVQVATGQINQSMMDWSAWASALTSKVDKTTLIECSTVIVTYENGASGYRIWSDGYCEQWGTCIANTGATWNNSVSLMKSFKDTNYHISINADSTPGMDWYARALPGFQKSLSSFLYYTNFSGASETAWWLARGYLAEGQY